MKHITSVNLDPETKEISTRMQKAGINRSDFIRECLRRWNALESSTHLHPTTTPKCLPSSRAGVCPICWPDGPPPQESWLFYRSQGGRTQINTTSTFNPEPVYEYHDYPTAWIEEKAREASTPNFRIPEMSASNGGVTTYHPPPGKWLRSLLSKRFFLKGACRRLKRPRRLKLRLRSTSRK
jgi:hypothetical protein